MISFRTVCRCPVAMLGIVVFFCGCGIFENDDEYATMRQQWLCETPPEGVLPISKIKSARAAGELGTAGEVVIRARINAGGMSPWTEDQAAFVVTDATGHDGAAEHDPHQCPFCRRDIRDHMAFVRFTDTEGRLIPVDARQLLRVTDGELLVVRGAISESEEDELAIDATQIHVVRKE